MVRAVKHLPQGDRQPRLEYAGFTGTQEKPVLRLKFHTDEKDILPLNGALARAGVRFFHEWDGRSKMLTLSIAVENQDEGFDLAKLLYQEVGFRLRHVSTEVGSRAFSEGNPKSLYEPQIMMIATHDKQDPTNRVGEFSLEIIRDALGKGVGFIADPTFVKPGQLRLLDFMHQATTDTEALIIAERDVKSVEARFGLFKAKQESTRLIDLFHRDGEAKVQGLKMRMHGLCATLHADSEEAVEAAVALLRRRYKGRIRTMDRDTSFHTVTFITGGEGVLDPAGMVAALHISTGCDLPVNITSKLCAATKLLIPTTPHCRSRQIRGCQGTGPL